VTVPKGTTDAGRADTVRKLSVLELAIADEDKGPEGFVIGAKPTDGGDARNTV